MPVSIHKILHDILTHEAGGDFVFALDRQEMGGRGDYSSNIAFVIAKKEKRIPMAVAEDLALRLKERHREVFSDVQAAAPGFLNFYLAPSYIWKQWQELFEPVKKTKKGIASVEYLSPNPTGPMHIGNARSGIVGDMVAAVLEEAEYKVVREYYHNDAGAQVARFGASIYHWYLVACKKESVLTEEMYQGPYIEELGRLAKKKFGTKLVSDEQAVTKLAKFALPLALKGNIAIAKRMGIVFDKIVYESALAKKTTQNTLDELKAKNLLVIKDGATWFAPKGESDPDMAVVKKSDGTLVYFANDIAYHKDKFSRADIVVDEFGENHEAHIAKLRAIAEIYHFPQEQFKIVVHGQVTLRKDGAVVSMSKRKGNFVTAEEVLDAVGKDAFRYFMLQYEPRSAMIFDVALAKEKSKNNPVYYIQYAYARAAGILTKSHARIQYKKINWSLLASEPELALAKHILEWQNILDKTADDLQIHRIARYAYELARSFTDFYETTNVLATEDKDLRSARLALVKVAQKTLESLMALMGISAPKKM